MQVASIAMDGQVHDTYFLVAHFHYTLLGGVILPLLAGIAYWFPKLIGRLPNERLGVASFVFVFLGVNGTFFPLHLARLEGMPRRVYTYPAGLGWDSPQRAASIGSFILLAGLVLYALSLLRSTPAGPDPWGRSDARVGGLLAAARSRARRRAGRAQRVPALGRASHVARPADEERQTGSARDLLGRRRPAAAFRRARADRDAADRGGGDRADARRAARRPAAGSDPPARATGSPSSRGSCPTPASGTRRGCRPSSKALRRVGSRAAARPSSTGCSAWRPQPRRGSLHS